MAPSVRYIPRIARSLDVFAVVLVLLGFYMALFYAPMEQTMGNVQRIFYFHVPSAMMAFLGFAIVLVASVYYLATGARRWDSVAEAGAEVGLVFCTITLLTGPVWAHSAWTVDPTRPFFWTWDPRLTTTLVLWLIYVAYFALRSYMKSDVRMRRFSAVLGIIGALDVPIVYFSVRWWKEGMHPGTFITKRGELQHDMAVTLRVAMVAFLLLFVALLLKRIALGRLREAHESLCARVETVEAGDRVAPVRPGGDP